MTEQTIPGANRAWRTFSAKLKWVLRVAPSVLGNTLIVLVMYIITISLITDTPILKVINDYYNLLK